MKKYEEQISSYIQYGAYWKLLKIVNSVIAVSRSRQFLNGMPELTPAKRVNLFLIIKAVRLLPTTGAEDIKDPVDLVLTSNFATKKKKLEDWGDRKEKERSKIFLERDLKKPNHQIVLTMLY